VGLENSTVRGVAGGELDRCRANFDLDGALFGGKRFARGVTCGLERALRDATATGK